MSGRANGPTPAARSFASDRKSAYARDVRAIFFGVVRVADVVFIPSFNSKGI